MNILFLPFAFTDVDLKFPSVVHKSKKGIRTVWSKQNCNNNRKSGTIFDEDWQLLVLLSFCYLLTN